MAINFPSSPTLYQLYTYQGKTWQWNGTAWINLSFGNSTERVDQSGGTSDTYGTLSGSVDSSNTVFTVSTGSYVSGSLTVYLNGQLQTQGTAEDWVETNPAVGTFTFNTAPTTGDLITAVYMVSASTSGNADTLDGQHGTYYNTDTQINAATAKTSFAITDYFGLTDSATSFVLKKIVGSDFMTSVINHLNTAGYLPPSTGAVWDFQVGSGTGTWIKKTIGEVGAVLTAVNGWIPVTDTWTRTGNHTFTVSGDLTSIYRKGTKVKYNDGAIDYGVIGSSSYSSPNTTVTLITNSDYAMAATTITSPYLSYVENPEGWPDWFNWTPTFTGFSADPTNLVHRWKVSNKTITCTIRHGTNGTSNSTAFTITAPIAAVTLTNASWSAPATALDNSAVTSTPANIVISSAATVFTCNVSYSSSNWTASGGKRIGSCLITYEF